MRFANWPRDCPSPARSCEVPTCEIGICGSDASACPDPECASAADCTDPPLACATPSCDAGACVYDVGACECLTDEDCTPGFATCAVAHCVDNACVTEFEDAECLEWTCAADPDPSCLPGADPFGGGDGSAGSPYLVCSPQQLGRVRDFPTAHFLLASDIELLGIALQPIASFSGTLDGNCHAIRNLRINDMGLAIAGTLFERLDGATVERLVLDNITATVSARNAAALAYQVEGGSTIRRVFASGSVLARERDAAGLVVQLSEGSSIEDSAFDGDVNVTGNDAVGGPYAGGLVLRTDAGTTVARSWTRGSVTVSTNSRKVGGFVGLHRGLIEQCVAAMDVVAGSRSAGFAAVAHDSVIRDCAVLDVTVTADVFACGVIAETHLNSNVLERVFSRAVPIAESLVYPVCNACSINGTLTDVIFEAESYTDTEDGVGIPRAQLFDPDDPTFAAYPSPPWVFVAGRYPVLAPGSL